MISTTIIHLQVAIRRGCHVEVRNHEVNELPVGYAEGKLRC